MPFVQSLLLLQTWSDRHVLDFELMEERVDVNAEVPSTKTSNKAILAMLTAQDDAPMALLDIVAWPSFEPIFSQEVSPQSRLIKTFSKQGISFLEPTLQKCVAPGHDSDDDDNDQKDSNMVGVGPFKIAEIFLRVLSEAVPLQRFQHLINKKEFKAAEELAKSSGLDVQLVHKGRITQMVNERASKHETLSDDDVQVALATLPLIDDDSFALHFCIHAVTSTLSQTKSLLDQACQLINKLATRKATGTTATPVAVGDIQRSIAFLGTYQLIWPDLHSTSSEAPAAGNDVPTGMVWQRFRDTDVCHEMADLLARGCISSAIILWNRHHANEPRLVQDLPDLLQSMPISAPSVSYVKWLQEDVVTSMREKTDMIRLHAWIEARTRSVEAYERKPHNALSIAAVGDSARLRTMPMLKFTSPATPGVLVSRSKLMSAAKDYSAEDALMSSSLLTLKTQLEDIVHLWDSYGLKISLGEYSQGHISPIAFRLLERVTAPELLQDAIEKEFKPYAARHDLAVDSLLREYCMEIMDSASTLMLAGSAWELRLLSVIPAIDQADMRVDVTLELMRQTPVPWSQGVQSAIDKALDVPNRARSEELQEQYRLMQLKKMLLRYGIKVAHISDVSIAKSLMRHIIANPVEAGVMDDALQIVNAFHQLSKYDAYVMRLQNLCLWARVDDIDVLLAPLVSSNTANYVAQEVLLWLKEEMDSIALDAEVCVVDSTECAFRPIDADVVKALTNYADCASVLVNYATSENGFENIKEWTVCAALLRDFQVYVPLEHLADKAKGLALLESFASVMAVRRAKATAATAPKANRLYVAPEDDEVWRETLKQQEQQEQEHAASNLRHRKRQQFTEINRMRRLADILGITNTKLQGIVAAAAARTGDAETALLACRELTNSPALASSSSSSSFSHKSVSEMVNNVAFFLSDETLPAALDTDLPLSESVVLLPDAVLRLGRQSVRFADDDNIAACLDNYKRFELEATVFHQCDAYDAIAQSENAQKTELDDKNPMDTHFYESGLVLKTSTAMPLLEAFLKPIAPASNHGKGKATDTPQTGMALGKYFLDNAAFQTALRTFKYAEERFVRPLVQTNAAMGAATAQQLTGYYRSVLENLVNKVLTARKIDTDLAFGYMSSLPMENAYNSFKAALMALSNSKRHDRTLLIAGVGLSCGLLWKQRGFQLDMKTMASNARWFQLLTALDIPFDEAQFRSAQHHPQYARTFVPSLLRRTGLDLATILQYAKTYHVDEDAVLLEYVRLSLPLVADEAAASELGHSFGGSSKGSSGSVVATPWNAAEFGVSYEDRIVGVFDDIDNKEYLIRVFKESLPQIRQTDYECLQFVYNQMLRAAGSNSAEVEDWKRSQVILEVLQTYHKRSVASNAHSTTEARRLPFLALVSKPWSILQDELNVETVGRLLPLALPLNIPPDEFYIAAVKRAVSDSLGFAATKPLLLKIRDTQSAMATTMGLAEQFATSPAEHLSALKVALAFAERWNSQTSALASASSSSDGAVIAQQAAASYARLRETVAATETQMQLTELKLSSLGAFVGKPDECLCQLFEQYSDKDNTFDIHVVAQDLATRHGCDLTRIRNFMILKWLRLPANKTGAFVGSLPSSTLRNSGSSTVKDAEATLQRKIIMTLKAISTEQIVNYLLNFAYQEVSQKTSLLSKARSLIILFTAATAEEISAVAPVDQVQEYLNTLLYLIDFEEVSIPQSAAEFTRSDKDGLVRALWRAHSKEVKVLALLANLMIDYHISDVQLWSSILQGLLKADKTQDLLSYLILVSAQPQLSVHLAGLPEMWQSTLVGVAPACLTAEDADLKPEQVKSHPLIAAVGACPFLSQLKLQPLVEIALDKNLVVLALALSRMSASLLDEPTLQSLATSLTEAHLASSLQVAVLSWPPAAAPEHLAPLDEWMFDQLDKRKWYNILLKASKTAPQLLECFIGWIVGNNRIQGLLRVTVLAKRYKQAEELCVRYLSLWHADLLVVPSATSSAAATADDVAHNLPPTLELLGMSELISAS